MSSISSPIAHISLRSSASHGNIRLATTSRKGPLAVHQTGPGSPHDSREEYRKTSLSSVEGQTLGDNTIGCFSQNTSSSAAGTPDESLSVAKRRTKRQSYFDYYPERSSQRTNEKKHATELDKGKKRSVDETGRLQAQAASVDSEDDSGCDTYGASTIRERSNATTSRLSRTSFATNKSHSRKGKEKVSVGLRSSKDQLGSDADQEGVAFPALQTSYGVHWEKLKSTNTSKSLTPSRSPNHPYGQFRDDVPGLRFSYSTNSSSQTQGGTPSPPQTPVEGPSRGFDPVHVVVEAPISCVEAMDALVDGMDGSDEDDLFSRMHRQSEKGVLSHHPLYAPPLPIPPPGVLLGNAHARKDSDVFSSDTEDTTDRNKKPESSFSAAKKGHGNDRGGSTSTVVSANGMITPRRRATDPSEQLPSRLPTGPPPSIDEIIRKHNVQDRSPTRKVTAPSISEIVRKNAPQSKQKDYRSLSPRTQSDRGHGYFPNNHEPEFEPTPASSETDIVARSSIDSIGAEVQETLRATQALAEQAVESSIFMPKVQDDLSRTLYGSKKARSAGGCDQSIRSGSASVTTSTGNTRSSIYGVPLPDHELSFKALQTGGGQKKQSSQKDAIATYLRSARVTTLLKLTKRPHASPDRPLTVSLSDLGSPTGHPLLVFLGLGCVRYVMGLYDEMADCLGLRLITIDRWGLGRTNTPSATASRGVPEWSTVVEEILDHLNIDRCSIMAHSAGAPYALSFANKYPERIVGDVCLLAPWVGGSAGGGYRWLKYVPNGILKTAQAAEWKIQAWMIGKPPKITYEGIGYNAKAPISSDAVKANSASSDVDSDPDAFDAFDDISFNADLPSPPSHPYAIAKPNGSRKSQSSANTFSDYDDLEDFGGRFESRTTLDYTMRRRSTTDGSDGASTSVQGQQDGGRTTKKKSSKGFLRIWKGLPNHANAPPVPSVEAALHKQQRSQNRSASSPSKQQGGKLKTLKSIGSLRAKSAAQSAQSAPPPLPPKSSEISPTLPQQDFSTSISLGLEEFGMSARPATPSRLPTEPIGRTIFPSQSMSSVLGHEVKLTRQNTSGGPSRSSLTRAGGRRSISFTASTASPSAFSRPPSSYSGHSHAVSCLTPPGSAGSAATTVAEGLTPKKAGESYQMALGNALIAASHAESARGTHTDLLQILNHEQRPWGFSYARYPHRVRVWYGDHDERIASQAVRWMESAMGTDRCRVTAVHGADHGLMYRTSTVVDVLEFVLGAWTGGEVREKEQKRNADRTYELSSDPFKSL